ncbi:translation initiation factor IF-2-like [Clupea harengus]|uniref:Translation initiation factor IF-2-like n=1 Tax=Clupea harengus TaxID=7950 RepID=A0A6P8GHR3_CLUHA|nr:translation initiation factor IF-2-like [Clupea harengus]
MSSLFMERRSPSPVPSSGEDTNRSDSPPRIGSLSRDSQIYASLQGPPLGREGTCEVRSAIGTRRASTAVQEWSVPRPGQAAPPGHNALPHQGPPLEMGEFVGKASPTPHRHQPPQYTGDSWSPSLERKQQATCYAQQSRDGPENHRSRGYEGHAAETPVSWTSQLQHWREERQTEEQEKSIRLHGTTPPVISSREVDKRRRNVSEAERGGGGGGGGGGSGGGGGTPGLSKSSSGVTGSIGDSSQLERDCLSAESSSQTSQRSSNGNNTAGVQSEDASGLESALRSQKIARAKWEFLYGAPAHDQRGPKDTPSACTAPSSGHSGKPPAPSSPPPPCPGSPSEAAGPRAQRRTSSTA